MAAGQSALRTGLCVHMHPCPDPLPWFSTVKGERLLDRSMPMLGRSRSTQCPRLRCTGRLMAWSDTHLTCVRRQSVSALAPPALHWRCTRPGEPAEICTVSVSRFPAAACHKGLSGHRSPSRSNMCKIGNGMGLGPRFVRPILLPTSLLLSIVWPQDGPVSRAISDKLPYNRLRRQKLVALFFCC